jgi:hypothetical protein
MAGTDSKEVEKVHEPEILPANEKHGPAAVARPSEFDRFLTDKMSADGDPETDPLERIVKQVLSAESADAVLTPVEVMQGRDIIGVPIIVVGFQLNKSDFDAGSPFYASMECLMPPEAVPQVVNCGHKKVLAQLVRLQELDAFPVNVQFITRGQSKQGTPMLELTKWPEQEQTEVPF